MVTPNMSHALAVGEMIEEFRIIRVLGTGGFGIVYECENTYLPETAAIKEFLPPELAYRGADGRVKPLSEQTEENFGWARDRFLQEAKTLWELARPEHHPNIVRVTRYREANGTAYMFMDFEQGRSLSEILKQREQLPVSELEALFYPLLDGLERIHASAILHRDIKPANILIRDDGTPVLIDFGAARRVVPGQERSIVASYTPVYAALEQYHEVGDQGPWTDIYSFGATLYQAVTGHKPLSAMERLCGNDQRSVVEECQGSYPQPILAAIDKALTIKPEERPRSVSEWRQCLAMDPDTSRADEATVVRPTFSPDDPTHIISPPKGTASTPAPPQVTSEPAPVVRPVFGPDDPTYITSPAKGTESIPAPPQVTSEPAPQEPRRRSARIWLIAGVAAVLLMVSGSGLYFFRNAFFPSPEPGLPPPEDQAGSSVDTSDGGTPRAEPDRAPLPTAAVTDEGSETTISDADKSGPGTDTPDISATRKPHETTAEIADGTQPRKESAQPPKPEPPPVPGTRFSDPMSSGGSGPIMVWLPAGEFQMGSASKEAGRNPDERRHLARVARPFAMGETELTLGHYRRFIEETGYRAAAGGGLPCLRPDENWQQLVEDWSLLWKDPGYEVTDRHPVACVSWSDAHAYAAWLSQETGHEYRLPTELEWEYAARAGTSASRFWGDNPKTGCGYANTAECKDTPTYAAPVGTFPPNPFGLREILGNLAEWTCSAYEAGYKGSEARCSERSDGAPRVLRGGSWLDAPVMVRSAARDGAGQNLRLNTLGFRLVRMFDPQ